MYKNVLLTVIYIAWEPKRNWQSHQQIDVCQEYRALITTVSKNMKGNIYGSAQPFYTSHASCLNRNNTNICKSAQDWIISNSCKKIDKKIVCIMYILLDKPNIDNKIICHNTDKTAF